VIPEENVALLAMVKGELDYMLIRSTEAFKLAQRAPRVKCEATPAMAVSTIRPNIFRAPLDDVRFRKALSHALDREEFVRTIREGMGTAEGIWSVIPPGVFGHVANVPSYPYDSKRAREFLAQTKLDVANLRPLVMIVRPEFRPEAEAALGYWAKLGVKLRIDVLSTAALRAREARGDYDFFYINYARPRPDQFLITLLSVNEPVVYGKIDDLIFAQRREVDPAKRRAILRQIQMKVAQDVPLIPFYRTKFVTCSREGVTGDLPNTFGWLWSWDLMDIK
jgi:peptide/nickel transport system substrate-binding protein